MLRKVPALALGFVACVAGASLAEAATVSRQSGEVLANSGGGYVAVATTAELPPGAQLLVRPGGSALIQYANGCSLLVGAERIWVIQENPPCEKGRSVDLTGRMGDGMSTKDTPQEQPQDHKWIIPGLLLAGGAAAAIILTTKDDDDPSSP
jgi:hypothetical protein